MDKSNLKFLLTLLKTNLLSAVSLRGVFVMRTIFMFFNNSIMLLIWFFVFLKFKTIHGWQVTDFALTQGILITAFSIIIIFAQGFLFFPRIVEEGNLDTFLLYPKNIIMNIACSRSDPSGFGDLLTGLIILVLSGYLSWNTLPLILLSIICGIIIIFSFLLGFGSLAFWFPRIEDFFHNLYMFFVIFGTQPGSIYYGLVKLIIFTLIPVGFISFLPIELIKRFDWLSFLFLLTGTAACAAISVFVFYSGLKRYNSGNLFGVGA